MTRDIIMAWDVEIPGAVKKHQDDPKPTVERRGLVIAPLWCISAHRSGHVEGETRVFLLDEQRLACEVIPLSRLRVVSVTQVSHVSPPITEDDLKTMFKGASDEVPLLLPQAAANS